VSTYETLIQQETRHWGSVHADPLNPQLWHDPQLFKIFFGREFRHFLNRIVAAGPTVLEFGCGEGHLALQLAQRGLKVHGIDLSSERIERARERVGNTPLPHPPTFEVGDLNTTTLPEQQYDAVVAHDALHHLVRLDHVLAQAERALKPHGRLLVLDFIGMKRIRKLIAATLYALLPTFQPYREKWKLRHRLRAFLATEESKRAALKHSNRNTLHSESPFEEISQESILREITARFDIVETFTFLPFWYYLAAKLKLSGEARYRAARFLRKMDDAIMALGLSKGAYVFIEARKRSPHATAA
jgi:ubiquinone/menaquinone biosynthesis C-methylase UbiE